MDEYHRCRTGTLSYLSNLKHLFLWQTKVTDAGVEQTEERRCLHWRSLWDGTPLQRNEGIKSLVCKIGLQDRGDKPINQGEKSENAESERSRAVSGSRVCCRAGLLWRGGGGRATAELARLQRVGLLRTWRRMVMGRTTSQTVANLQLVRCRRTARCSAQCPSMRRSWPRIRQLIGDPVLLHLDQVFLKPGRHGRRDVVAIRTMRTSN